MPGEQLVIWLVGVVQQAVVAGGAASFTGGVLAGVEIEVAQSQGFTGNGCKRVSIVDELTQDASATLRRFL